MRHELSIAILERLLAATKARAIAWRADPYGNYECPIGDREVSISPFIYEAENCAKCELQVLHFLMPGFHGEYASGTQGYDLIQEILNAGLEEHLSDWNSTIAFLNKHLPQEKPPAEWDSAGRKQLLELSVIQRLLKATEAQRITWTKQEQGAFLCTVGGQKISFEFLYYESQLPPDFDAHIYPGIDRHVVKLSMPGLQTAYASGTQGYDLFIEILALGFERFSIDRRTAVEFLDQHLPEPEPLLQSEPKTKHELELHVIQRLLKATHEKRIVWVESGNTYWTASGYVHFCCQIGGESISFYFDFYESSTPSWTDRQVVKLRMPGLIAAYSCGTEGFHLFLEILAAAFEKYRTDSFDAMKFLDEHLPSSP